MNLNIQLTQIKLFKPNPYQQSMPVNLQTLGIPPKEISVLLTYPFIVSALDGKLDTKIFLENLAIFADELRAKGITDKSLELLRLHAPQFGKMPSFSEQRSLSLNPHQQALGYGALYDVDDAVITYTRDSRGNRVLSRVLTTPVDFEKLVVKFRNNPKDTLAVMRNNMLGIARDTALSSEQRLERLRRYIDDYFDLMCILDRYAFPSTNTAVHRGIPEYVMDNLVDMGSDPTPETPKRSGREKLKVQKKPIFKWAAEFFESVFAAQGTLANSGAIFFGKSVVFQKIAKWVYENMPYDTKNLGMGFGQQTVDIEQYLKNRTIPKAVCRHHALVTQVLNQAFGLTSRLLKCRLDTGKVTESHAANIVRVDTVWHLLDVTNPIMVNGNWQICLVKIPEQDIDLNKNFYTWKVKHDSGTRTYTSRKDMYFQIR